MQDREQAKTQSLINRPSWLLLVPCFLIRATKPMRGRAVRYACRLSLAGSAPTSTESNPGPSWKHRRISGFCFTPPKAGNLSVFLGQEKSDLKSENIKLPVELRMVCPEVFTCAHQKPIIKTEPAKKLSRIALGSSSLRGQERRFQEWKLVQLLKNSLTRKDCAGPNQEEAVR